MTNSLTQLCSRFAVLLSLVTCTTQVAYEEQTEPLPNLRTYGAPN